MSQILNSGSISFRLLILILSLFQCLCYREHIKPRELIENDAVLERIITKVMKL